MRKRNEDDNDARRWAHTKTEPQNGSDNTSRLSVCCLRGQSRARLIENQLNRILYKNETLLPVQNHCQDNSRNARVSESMREADRLHLLVSLEAAIAPTAGARGPCHLTAASEVRVKTYVTSSRIFVHTLVPILLFILSDLLRNPSSTGWAQMGFLLLATCLNFSTCAQHVAVMFTASDFPVSLSCQRGLLHALVSRQRRPLPDAPSDERGVRWLVRAAA